MPLGLGLGISKLKSLISGLRVRFQGNATITAALDGILRDLSADFVSNGTVTAALEAIKLLDVDFSGEGTLTADLASFTGLLDDYPNAAAAYSVRLLKSDYTGPLVRIRKDTGGQPEKDFYPDSNNELSLNSSDGGTTLGSWIGSNDGYVVTWYDQSGNSGRDATKSLASAQPQIVSSGSLITDNGKPAVEYNLSELSNIYNVDELASIASVASSSDSSSEQNIYNLDLGDSVRTFALGYNRNGSNTIGSTTRDPSSVFYESGENLTDLSQKLFLQIGSCASGLAFNNLYIDQTLGTQTYNCRSTGSGGISIGARDSAFYLSGKIQEVVIWESNQSTNRTGIESNINDYYSIY